MAPRLRIQVRDASTELALGAEPVTVGRGNRCTVVVPFPEVPEVALRIERRGGAHFLAGAPAPLRHGDVLEAGEARCTYLEEEEAPPRPPPPSSEVAPQGRWPLYAGAAAALVAALLLFLFLRPGGAPAEELFRSATEAATAAEKEPDAAEARLREAVARFERFLAENPRSAPAATARLALERARQALEALDALARDAPRPDEPVDLVYERLGRYKAHPHPAVVARAVKLQAAFEEARARAIEEVARAAEAEAAEQLRGRAYAAARRAYEALLGKGAEFKARAEAGLRAVEETARADYEALVEAAGRADDLDARIALLEASRAAFAGTRHAEDLEIRIAAARARRTPLPETAPQPKREPSPPEPAPPAPPEPEVQADSPEVVALVRARRFGEAAARLAADAASPGKRARAEELALVAGLFEDLKRSIQSTPERFGEVEVRPSVRRDVVAADDLALRVRGPNGEEAIAWEQLPAKAFPRLLRLAGLAEPPRLAYALLLDELELSEQAEAAYAACVEAGADVDALARALARRRGIPLPADGFVVHEGRVVTRAQRDALVLRAKLARLEADAASGEGRKRAAAFDALEGLGEAGRETLARAVRARARAAAEELRGLKAFSREHAIAALGPELARRRADALAFILDPAQYPYPNPPPEAQPEAERRVERVREVFERPYALLVKGSERAREVDRELEDLDARLRRAEPDAPSLAEEARAAAVAALDLATLPFDAKDKERLAHNAAVARYNRELKETSADEEERANVEAVNEYRSMMGLYALKIDERLVRAARKHSIEMAQLDYFLHESPTPALREPGMRARREGYGGGVAENIARGPATGRDAFWGWFRSSGHHRNMLQPGHTEMGCGAARRHYWTQLFGSLTGRNLDPPRVPPDPDPPGTSGNGRPPLE